MSLLVYNLTAAPLTLANGLATVIPASTAGAGVRGLPWYASNELKGRSGTEYTAVQAQQDAGLVVFQWSDVPEYPVGTLVVEAVAADATANPLDIYVNGSTGSDTNPGTSTAPVATIAGAHALVSPLGWKRRCRVIMDTDGVGRSYVYPGPTAGLGFQEPLGLPQGPFGTPIQYLGARQTLVAQQAETVGGSNNTATIVIPQSTLTADPGVGGVVLALVSVAGLQPAGIVKVDSELIRYTAIVGLTLTGCSRGYAGTAAAAHIVGSTVFQFFAGHFLQQTGTPTVVAVAPVAPGDVVINVGSTTGWPSASTVRIDNELITYTGKTPTTITGCTRGTNNTTAAAHSLGAAVTLIGQRKSIKTNTATTVTVTNNYSVVSAIGDTFTINTAGATGTRLTSASLDSGPLVGSMLIKDCDLTGVFAPSYGQLFLRGCTTTMLANGSFTAGAVDSDVAFGAGSGAWLPDGAENPCLGQEDNAGLRVEGQSVVSHTTNFIAVRGNGRSSIVGVIVAIHANINVDTSAATFNTLVCLHGGALIVKEGAYFRLDNPNAANHCLLSGAQFLIQRGGIANVARFDINNVLTTGALVPSGDAIVVEQGGLLDFSEMSGTGNAGVGLNCRDGIARSRDTLSTITGTLGDMKCGARPVRTWADFNAAVPASGLPSKSELDVPGFVARPFKLAFAGLVAAASFDITTLGAFATPAGATAVLSSIWQGSPPAIGNVSTLRVTTVGTAALGARLLSDSGDTPTATVATVSDDGKTVTFEGTVTGFTIEYLPIAGLAQATASMGGRIYQQNVST